MSEYLVDKQLLLTEGDVELKVIFPLLTNPEPNGLGYLSADIHSKLNLRKLKIEKGKKAHLYFPDFLINIDGIPLVIIEAKKPDENLEEAFRQASLYAAEINRFFKRELNPCQLIIACDGQELVAGTWDSANPRYQISIDKWTFTNEDFAGFTSLFSKSKLRKKSISIRQQIRTQASYKNPLYLIGGKYVQNQSNNNAFGESISIQYQHLFNPNEESERKDIVANAYVKVTKHQSHVEPIDRLIRKKIRPAIEDSTEIQNTENPVELLSKLDQAHNYNNQVLLLIGSVGSGKSTFTTYLKEVALEEQILAKTFWTRLNLNDAPVNSQDIYKWLKTNLILQIQKEAPIQDYEKLSFIETLYSEEIAALKKGALSLLDSDSEKYKGILVDKLLIYQDDVDLTLSCYIRELIHKKNRNLIIVLDNCDKRNLEEQLLMFDVANWIKDNVKAIVFLPLRDTTFDHFRNEKPLDTVVKDLIFRINPPSLEKVIYQRIKYANRLSEKLAEEFYYLPNGWKVHYPSVEELHYLKSILTSLFQNNFFKMLITGLAGRDIRKGIEIFLDFCKSGYITDREILKIKQSKGKSKLPNHIISRVFLRGNRLYYSGEDSRIKNLFASDPNDDLPDPFIRIAILKWLDERRRKNGPSGIKGFHRTDDLLQVMSRFGHSITRTENELLFLLKNHLIISESQDTSKLNPEDLISINPPGIAHYQLLSNIDYLSSCSENSWFKTVSVAEEIASDLTGQGEHSHLSIQNSAKHAEMLVDYLQEYFDNHFQFHTKYLSEDNNNLPLDFNLMRKEVTSFKERMALNPYVELPAGSVHKVSVLNLFDYGIMCSIIEAEQTGLIHVSQLPENYDELYEIGDEIEVEIITYAAKHKKYSLKVNK